MKFIVDTQLPFKLSKLIRDKGYDCIHTTDMVDGQYLDYFDKIIDLYIDGEEFIEFNRNGIFVIR